MRIAVVDDDYRTIAQITDYLSVFFGNEPYSQDDYSDGVEFVSSLSENKYNIVFMDLEMEKTNGADAIKAMREIDKDDSTFVIFVSSHNDNLIPLFALHPFGFIQKPFLYEDVSNHLINILSTIEQNKRLIQLTINRKIVLIPVADIMYVDSERRKVKIHLKDQKNIETYLKMDYFEEKLKEISNDFLRIHTSFLVNRKYVTLYKKDCLLIDGTELQISRKYVNSVMENLHRNL